MLIAVLKSGPLARPADSTLLLLFDTWDRHHPKAGIFAADVRLKRPVFVIERPERLHIREL
jgi:hypothetical protein